MVSMEKHAVTSPREEMALVLLSLGLAVTLWLVVGSSIWLC
jgi:hypothetical protein